MALDRADRKYLIFSVTALSLLVLGAAAYKPLRFWYAIYSLRHTTGDDYLSEGRTAAWKANVFRQSVRLCRDAALEGNQAALEAIIDARCLGDGWVHERAQEASLAVVLSRTGAFYQALDGRPKAQVFRVLRETRRAALRTALSDLPPEFPQEFSAEKARQLVLRLEEDTEHGHLSSELGRFAPAALEYARRRFAKELAEARTATAQ